MDIHSTYGPLDFHSFVQHVFTIFAAAAAAGPDAKDVATAAAQINSSLALVAPMHYEHVPIPS